MTEALKGQAEEDKGLSEIRGFVEGAPDVALLGVAYRPKAHEPGLVLGVCPWCCASLCWWPTVVDEQATEEAGE